MTLSVIPMVDMEALIQLRRVLDYALGKKEFGVVEGGHRLEVTQGGANGQNSKPTEQLELDYRPRRIPERKVLPLSVQEEVFEALTGMFRDRCEQRRVDQGQEQGGSKDE